MLQVQLDFINVFMLGYLPNPSVIWKWPHLQAPMKNKKCWSCEDIAKLQPSVQSWPTATVFKVLHNSGLLISDIQDCSNIKLVVEVDGHPLSLVSEGKSLFSSITTFVNRMVYFIISFFNSMVYFIISFVNRMISFINGIVSFIISFINSMVYFISFINCMVSLISISISFINIASNINAFFMDEVLLVFASCRWERENVVQCRIWQDKLFCVHRICYPWRYYCLETWPQIKHYCLHMTENCSGCSQPSLSNPNIFWLEHITCSADSNSKAL